MRIGCSSDCRWFTKVVHLVLETPQPNLVLGMKLIKLALIPLRFARFPV